ADTDEPRLRVDPLKSGCAPKTEGLFLWSRVTATCRGNLPRQPEQKANAPPLENQNEPWTRQNNDSKAEGHKKHHESHPDDYPTQARKPTKQPNVGTCRG